MEKDNNPFQFLEKIGKFWYFLAFIVFLVVWYANISKQVESNSQRIAVLEQSNKESLVALQKIQVDIAVIRKELEITKK